MHRGSKDYISTRRTEVAFISWHFSSFSLETFVGMLQWHRSSILRSNFSYKLVTFYQVKALWLIFHYHVLLVSCDLKLYRPGKQYQVLWCVNELQRPSNQSVSAREGMYFGCSLVCVLTLRDCPLLKCLCVWPVVSCWVSVTKWKLIRLSASVTF